MPFEDFIISLLAKLLIFGFPIIVLLLFAAPFIFIKLRKRKFTATNVIIGLFIGTFLAATAVVAAYWGILLLGAVAVYQLYGGQI